MLFRSDAGAQLALARQYLADGARDKAVECLRQASGGTVEAKAALGRHLLSQPPLSPQEGVRLTKEAAEAGHGEAMHLMAVLDASGQLGPANWPLALAKLRHAAELGYEPAAAQIALLARDPQMVEAVSRGETLTRVNLERLFQAIDLRRWFDLPRARVVSQAPRIAVVENFVPPEICDWIVDRGRPLLKLAPTDDPSTGQRVYGEGRTNSAAELDLAQTDVVMHLVRARISALSGPPTSAMEAVGILHYQEIGRAHV